MKRLLAIIMPVILAVVVVVAFLLFRGTQSSPSHRGPSTTAGPAGSPSDSNVNEATVPDPGGKQGSRPAGGSLHASAEAAQNQPPQDTPQPSRENGFTEKPQPTAAGNADEGHPPTSDIPAPSELTDMLKDASKPMEERRKILDDLAERGDEPAVDALMAAGQSDAYLAFAAIEALGKVRNEVLKPQITRYLRNRLNSGNLKVLSAAIRSLGQAADEKAVPVLSQVIRDNRRREDGFEEMVLTAAVDTLRKIGSREAVPVLSEELARSKEGGWSLEYGSSVVSALDALGSEQARSALASYAEMLSQRMPEDPLAAEHYRKKIAEARRAAGMN